MGNRYILYACVILVLVLAISVFGCGCDTADKSVANDSVADNTYTNEVSESSEGMGPFTRDDTTEPVSIETADGDESIVEKSVYIIGEDGLFASYSFDLPDLGTVEYRQGNYAEYSSANALEFEGFISKLRDEGFTVDKGEEGCYLAHKNSCVVFASFFKSGFYDDGSMARIEYYVAEDTAYDGSITPTGAKEYIEHLKTDLKGSYSYWPLESTTEPCLPLDLTPKGFYENTGAQIFMQPIRITDEFSDYFYSSFFLITEDYTKELSYRSVAVADTDGNGVKELWTFFPGPTSGIFTISLSAIENGKVKYCGCFQPEHQYLSFAEKDGKLCIKGTNLNEDQEGVYFTFKFNGEQLALRNGDLALAPSPIPTTDLYFYSNR